MYKIEKITTNTKKCVDTLFNINNLEGLNVDVFKNEKWKTIYIESRPFIDNDSYRHFKEFFCLINEEEINYINYPFAIGEEYLSFNEIPDFQMFDEVMEKSNLRYTGGLAYGSSMKWAIHSDPDNHILFLGYDDSLHDEIQSIFKENDFLRTKEDITNIYSEQSKPLSPVD